MQQFTIRTNDPNLKGARGSGFDSAGYLQAENGSLKTFFKQETAIHNANEIRRRFDCALYLVALSNLGEM